METHKPVIAPSPEAIKAFRDAGLHEQADFLEKKFNIDYASIEKWLNQFITQDPVCNELKSMVRVLSLHQDCVLIHGETGTGKELIARALHGGRKGKLVAINCAGMPRELVESELFGYAAGSFTGAKGEQPGLISIADEGSVLLDEVGDLPLDLQAKLLRVIQEKKLRKVGAKEEQDINTRFIAATHIDLAKAVELERFRKDLYARLSTFEIKIPPLRDRTADIPLIIASLGVDPSIFNNTAWDKIDLSLNVRVIQQIVRRYQVFDKVMVPAKQ